MKRFVLIALTLSFSLLLVACAPVASPAENMEGEVIEEAAEEEAPSEPQSGGTLIGARKSEVAGLDPHTSPAFASKRIFELVYSTLVRFDGNMTVAPELAESWEVADDGLTVTFNLRAGVKFHDGSDLTSEDVKYTFERILDEESGAVARSFFVGVNAIETPDAQTVVMTLDNPNAALLNNMANANASIVSKAIAEAGELNTTLIGSGPFMLAEWEADNFMRFEANPDFYIEGVPLLDGVEMRVIPDESSILAGLRAGDIDWAIIEDPKVAILAQREAALNTMKAPSLAYHLMGINTTREPFTDERVRQAMSCAIDRQQIVDVASLGEGQVTGPLTSPFFALDADAYECYTPNLEKARSLLADAGYADGFSFTLMAPSVEPATAIADAQSIQSQLKEIGIELEIEPLELGIYVERWLAADFDAWVGINSGSPDPDFMLYRYWHSTGNLNFVPGWNDAVIDELLDEGKRVSAADERQLIYADAQKKLVDAAPWIWTYVGFEYRTMQPHVQGYTALSDGSILYLRDVWLDK